MANTFPILNYANTFGDWMVTTSNLVKENNDLAANNYLKSTGTLFLNDPTTGLSVANNSYFYGGLHVTGAGAFAQVDNNLGVGGKLTTTGTANVGGTIYATSSGVGLEVTNNTVLKSGLDVTGAATLRGTASVAGAVTLSGGASVSNGISVSGTTTLQNSVSIGGATTISNTLSATGVISTGSRIIGDNITGNSTMYTVTLTVSNQVTTDTIQANSFVNTATSRASTANAVVLNAGTGNVVSLSSNTIVANTATLTNLSSTVAGITTLNVSGVTTLNNLVSSVVNSSNTISTNVYSSNVYSTNGSIDNLTSKTATSDKVVTSNISSPLSYVTTQYTNQGFTNAATVNTLQSNTSINTASLSVSNNVYAGAIYANNAIRADGVTGYFGNVVTSSLTVGGNFVVTGSTINTSNTIFLNSNSTQGVNSYVTVVRGSSTNASLRWNETNSYWEELDISNGNWYRILTDEYLSSSVSLPSTTTVATAQAANTLNNSINNINNVNNIQNTSITTAASYANSAFVTANSAGSYANSAFTTANAATTNAAAAYNQANTATTNAGSAYNQANTATSNAAAASSYANAAFIQANTAVSNALAASSYANSAFLAANNAIASSAASAGVYANGAFIQANTAISNAAAASSYANSAFAKANSAATSVNIGNTTVSFARNTGNLNIIGVNTDGWSQYLYNPNGSGSSQYFPLNLDYTNSTANSVVRTDNNGYLQTGWLTSTLGASQQLTTPPTYIWGLDSSTNYLKTFKPTNVIVGYANNIYSTTATAKQIHYQTGASTTGFIDAPTTDNTFLRYNNTSGLFQWDSVIKSVAAGSGISASTTAGAATVSLASSGVTTGTYTNATVTVDAYGRITSASSGSGSGVSSVTGTTYQIAIGGTSTNPTIGLASPQAGTGTSYNYPTSMSVDSYGRVVSITGGSAPGTGTVTSISAGTGLSGGTITTSGTLSLGTSGVSAGSYSYPSSIYVDSYGRITSISSGSSGVSSVFGRTGSVTASSGDYSSYYGSLSGTNSWSGTNSFSGTTNLGSSGYYVNFNGIANFTAAQAGASFGRASPNGNFAAWVQPRDTVAGTAGLVTQTYGGNSASMATMSTATGIVYYWFGDYGASPTNVGVITTNGSSTFYNTTSDHRLKENIVPLTDAVSRVKQLLPRNYTWKNNPSVGVVEGFIAHELQSVVPDAVHGVKDAVDEEGNPKYQSVDTSVLIPVLTAALQEALARIEALEAKVGK